MNYENTSKPRISGAFIACMFFILVAAFWVGGEDLKANRITESWKQEVANSISCDVTGKICWKTTDIHSYADKFNERGPSWRPIWK